MLNMSIGKREIPSIYMLNQYRCRADGPIFYATMLTPFVVTYSFNIIIYLVIITSLSRQIFKKRGIIKGEIQRNEYKKLAIVAFFLAIMFGLAWIFALLVIIPNTILSYISQYLFSILVGFQGILYFIMHVIRSQEARKFWITLFYKPCPTRIPAFLKSWTTTTPYLQTKPVNLRSNQNPLYSSQDNLMSSPGESTFNTLQHPRDSTDIGMSPSSYSLASQTLQIDFTLPTIISDDDESSMDMQELTDIINSRFADPNAPGVAISPPHMPISSAHENICTSPLTSQSHEMPMKEYTLHVETNEGADNLAYDNVFQVDQNDSEER